MTNTESADSGCFSAVLRRLLCSGTPPQTHPSDSDHVVLEPNKTKKYVNDANNEATGGSAPGVVARLMGLEAFPEGNWIPKVKSPGSVTRSRSVNFMDYFLDLDLTQAKHRRVRTSLSFREVPAASQLQQKQSHDVLFLYLDNVEEKTDAKSRPKKLYKEEGSSDKQKEIVREGKSWKEENQGKKNKKISKLKNEPRRVSIKHAVEASRFSRRAKDVQITRSASSKAKLPLKMENQKKGSAMTRKKKKERRVKEACTSHNSENLRPVTFLNANVDFSITHKCCSSETARHPELKSKKKSSSTAAKCHSPFADISDYSIVESIEIPELIEKIIESAGVKETEHSAGIVGKLFKLTEEDIRQSNWFNKKVFSFEDFEDICMEIGEQILNLMLDQLVDEVVKFTWKISA